MKKMIIPDSPKIITIKELFEDEDLKNLKEIIENNDWYDRDVRAYGGKLNIKPKYQREFRYHKEQMQKVMQSIMENFPLNNMYWVKNSENDFELLDGQQRTLSIASFLVGGFSFEYEDDNKYFSDLVEGGLIEKVLNYKLRVYIVDGNEHERVRWFRAINAKPAIPTEQEKLNAGYTGLWLSDAKKAFSRKSAASVEKLYRLSGGDWADQTILEKSIKWFVEYIKATKIYDNIDSVEDYMSFAKEKYKNGDASELIDFINEIYDWVEKCFAFKHERFIKNPNWWKLFFLYSNFEYNYIEIQREVDELMSNEDFEIKKGIYEYVLAQKTKPSIKNMKLVTSRLFDVNEAYEVFISQKMLCNSKMCRYPTKEWKFNEMEADHKLPWSKGGPTNKSNLQMLCIECNREKSNK